MEQPKDSSGELLEKRMRESFYENYAKLPPFYSLTEGSGSPPPTRWKRLKRKVRWKVRDARRAVGKWVAGPEWPDEEWDD